MGYSLNKLTTMQCSKFKCPPSKKRGWLGDGGGLWLRADSNQAKYWIFRFRLNSEEVSRSLGTYPMLSLSQARTLRDEQKILVKQGVDPNVEKKKQLFTRINASEVTFSKAYNDTYKFYTTKKLGAWSEGHEKRCKSIYNKYLSNPLGSLPLTEIADEMILEVLEGIYKTAPVTCQKAKHLISVVFNYAKDKRIFKGFNPVMHLKGNSLIAPTKPVHRVELPQSQVGEYLVKNSRNKNIFIKHYLYFNLVTALRVSSLRLAKWSWYDERMNTLNIPSGNMKNRKFFRCPLPIQAIPRLQELRQYGDKPDEIIFKGASKKIGEEGCLCANTPNNTIKKSYGFKADVHGLRSTFNRFLTKSKRISIEVIEAQMSHKYAPEVRMAYMGDEDYFDERKEAVQYLADWLDDELLTAKKIAVSN